MDALKTLLDETFTVPRAPPADTGVAWLRSEVARFSEGEAHLRRRRLVEGLLAGIQTDRLRRAGDHVATLAEVLGLDRSAARDVRLVAGCYQPHTEISPEADAALERLIRACGGHRDEATANRIGVLVQACDATANLIAGSALPVQTTRRLDPDGREVVVDLTDLPFGAGRHECPGRDHASALAAGASRFHRLHDGPEPLVLPNAWDVASAALFTQAGFTAIGTTSLGVAAAAGVPDARGLAYDETMRLARALSRLPLPITVDIEAGWGLDPTSLAVELSEIGIAGVNIEDGHPNGLTDPGDQARTIEKLKAGAPNLFVNARTDTYWLARDTESTLERARRYVDAGADGIFVPGLTDERAISEIVSVLTVPLNLLAGGNIARLGELGVRRISTGSLLYRTALTAALANAVAVRAGSDPRSAMEYHEVDALTAVSDLPRARRPQHGS